MTKFIVTLKSKPEPETVETDFHVEEGTFTNFYRGYLGGDDLPELVASFPTSQILGMKPALAKGEEASQPTIGLNDKIAAAETLIAYLINKTFIHDTKDQFLARLNSIKTEIYERESQENETDISGTVLESIETFLKRARDMRS